ncbi:hypothetical protein VP496E541_P0079 [Vibrio phage 496E54-1]|nr:hypothetical protein VP496E541_P0079 [Vibrio phage 496E54-1]
MCYFIKTESFMFRSVRYSLPVSLDSYIFLYRADYIITLCRGCALPFKEVLYGYYPTLLPLGCTLLALHLRRWLSIVVAPFLSDLAQRLSST